MTRLAFPNTTARPTLWLIVGFLLAASPGRGDWPLARHDSERTGASGGVSAITRPAPFWRYYLGSLLGANDAIVGDADRDGQRTVFFVGAGRITASRGNGIVLWRSALLDFRAIHALDDFDGDGQLELVAATQDHVFVIAASDGRTLWKEPDGEMGVIGAVRVADLSGDGLPDVLIQECTCCGVTSGKTGFAYSFGQRFGNASLLYALPGASCGASSTTVFLGPRGNPMIALFVNDAVSVIDGRSGHLVASTPGLGALVAVKAQCEARDLDGVSGQELVCLRDFVSGSDGDRDIFVVRFSETPVPSASILWKRRLAPLATGSLASPTELAINLDGTEMWHVVVGVKESSRWDTQVIRSLTGSTEVVLEGERPVGAVHVASHAGALVLTENDSPALSAWVLGPVSSDAGTVRELRKAWTLEGQSLLTVSDSKASRLTASSRRSAVLVPGTGETLKLYTINSSGSRVRAYAISGETVPTPGPEYRLPAGSKLQAAWVIDKPGATLGLAIARNDGYLVFLDSALVPLNEDDSKGIRGVQIGGYSALTGGLGASPVVARLDSGGLRSSVVVRDSRGALLRIDPNDATNTVPPTPVWELPSATAPAIVPGLNAGQTGIACVREFKGSVNAPATYAVSALRSDGSELWTAGVPGAPLDVLPGVLDRDAVPDLLVQTVGSRNEITIQGYSGRSGSSIWSTPGENLQWGVRPFAAHDWNGDGFTDVIGVVNTLRVWSGVSGGELASWPGFLGYAVPTLVNIDNMPDTEILLGGGALPNRAFDSQLNTSLWTSSEDVFPFPMAAIAACRNDKLLLQTSLRRRGQMATISLSQKPGVSSFLVLAGGRLFPDLPAAIAANAAIGQLGEVTVAQDLTGKGRPTAVVGSSDGHLYGLNPCDLSLDFSYDFGAPVGESVFGDVNGDGYDEIFVTVSDGYLYQLREAPLPAPQNVIDTDPSIGITDTDVDTIATENTLYGAWQPVVGASSYDVAIVSAGAYVTPDSPWQNVGNVSSARVIKLPLQEGRRYEFVVRANGVSGTSPDSFSDGVIVNGPAWVDGSVYSSSDSGIQDSGAFDVSDDASLDARGSTRAVSGGSGCSCTITDGRSDGSGATNFLGSLLAFLLYQRRRRHPA